MDPVDPRYITPELEIVPVEPTASEERQEESFWEKNSHVPIEKLIKRGKRRDSPKLPN